MKKELINNLSAETLAAFLDGNATLQEQTDIIKALPADAELRELLHISQSVDADLGMKPQDCEWIPMTAMAATCNEENYCCLVCEKYVLGEMGIDFNEELLLKNAIQNGWQKEQGTALHNIGRHLESMGLVVSRRFKCTVEDISNALAASQQAIVAVDGGELSGSYKEEQLEDLLIDEVPDHSVVILSCDLQQNVITVFDPNSMNAQDTYPLEQFMNAWADSKNYLVTVELESNESYVPHLIDLSDVELGEELIELREAIAEHAHNVWAAERQTQGWTYGPQRDDEKKQTPCMVPYSKLPENEKTFDRDMAMNTIKLLKKLGWDLVKRK